MKVHLVTPAAELAVTLAEAKKEVDVALAITYHDDRITRLIKVATQQATVRSGRQLLTASYQLIRDRFPLSRGNIPLPFPPLQSVESVKYYDTNGVQQTLANTVYRLLDSREPAELCLKYGQYWPDVYDEPDAVEINYTAGVGNELTDLGDEDEWMRQAVLMLVRAYWMRDQQQPHDALMRAAELILEAHRCGDDFVEYEE